MLDKLLLNYEKQEVFNMIRLLESNDPNIELYEVVRFAGYDWYVIQIEGDIATLLSAKTYEVENPNTRRKGEEWNDFARRQSSYSYKDSFIRQYLLDEILPDLEAKGAKLIPTILSDAGCTDKVFLLSKKEGIGAARKLGSNVAPLVLNLYGRDDKNTYNTDHFYIAIRTKLENLVPVTPSKPNTSGVTSDEEERIEEEILQFTEDYGERGEYAIFDEAFRQGRKELDKYLLSKFKEMPSFDASSVVLLRCATGRLPGIEGYFDEFWDEFTKNPETGWQNGWTGFVDLSKVWRSTDPATQYIIDNAAFCNDEETSYHVRWSGSDYEIDDSGEEALLISFDL